MSRNAHFTHRLMSLVLAALTMSCLLAAQIKKGGSHPGYGQITAGRESQHDRSKPLREIEPISPSSHLDRLSLPIPSGQMRLAKDSAALAAAEPEVNGGTGVTATLDLNIAGLGWGFTGPGGTFDPTVNPSDATGAIGTTQYLQWVDDSFVVFDKATGNALYGPAAGNTIWKGFGGVCEADNDGQPTVNFDKLSKTWVVSQYAIASGPPYQQCVAVSTTADATGTWNRYAFIIGAGYSPNWINKNAKLGVWPNGYYMSFDMYNGTTFAGDELCALQRQNMLSGLGAGIQCVQMESDYFGIVVSDLDSATPPPSGAPAYFAADDTYFFAIDFWKFQVDWNDSQNSNLSLRIFLDAGVTNPSCSPFSFQGLCVPQPGTGNLLDVYGDRLTGRMPYRNYGDHQSLFGAETDGAAATPTGGPAAATAIRFYEMRISTTGDVSMYQAGTFAPDASNFRFIPSIASDRAGNVAVAYNLSSTQTFPSQYAASRAPGDPLNTLGNETLLNPGNASQTATTLWDTRSSLSVDPVDDCTYWYTQQYIPFAGSSQWVTQIVAFTLAGCPVSTVTLETSPASLLASLNGGPFSAAPVSGTYNTGSILEIATESPQSGATGTQYVFQSWSDGGAITQNITVPSAGATYTAAFNTQYSLTTLVVPGASGTVTPASGSFFNADSVVNLTATPATGYAFTNWTGSVANSKNAKTTITMNSPLTVKANFRPLATQVKAALAGRTGPSNARVWTFSFTNEGPGQANNVVINTFVVTQSAGTPCSPSVIPKLPIPVGSIAPGGVINGQVAINFSSCAANARFSLAMQNMENNGASHSTLKLNNLSK